MARLDGSDRGALVSVDSVRRLARALQAYEQGNRDIPGRKLRTAFDEGGASIRVGRTVEPWVKGTTQEIELIYINSCFDDGSGSGSGQETLEVVNTAFDVAFDRRVVVGQAENGCWYLLHAESCEEENNDVGEDACRCVEIGGQDLTKLPGYDNAKTQVLVHESGCLKWIDTTECEEGSGS